MAYLLGAMLDPLMFLPVLAAITMTKPQGLAARFFVAVASSLATAVIFGAMIWADAPRVARHVPIVLIGSSLWFFIFLGIAKIFKEKRA